MLEEMYRENKLKILEIDVKEQAQFTQLF